MRSFCLILLMCLASFGVPQEGDEKFVRPDATIVISEHPTTAEGVEVTMLDAKYPKDLLQSQCLALGNLLGVPPRGLAVYVHSMAANDPNMQFLKAKFAVNGLIDRNNGVLNLEPILKAFVGAPKPFELKALKIIFSGETPNKKTVQAFAIPSVLIAQAKASTEPKGIEYTVQLLSQDASLITFPTDVNAAAQILAPKTSPKSNLVLIISLLAVAATAGGVLVYLALLRGGRRAARP